MPHNFRILFARVGGQNANCANLDQGDGTFQLKKIKNLPGQPYNAEDGIVCPQISTLTGCWISYSRSWERSAFSCRNRGTISGSRAPTDAPVLTRLDIFQKRIGDVGPAVVRNAGRLAFDILHQPIEIIPGIGNADHAYGRTIP